MPTALLVGSFGQRNPGDEALADAFGRALPEWRMVTAASVPARPGDSASLMVNGRSAPALARALYSCDAVIVAGGTVFKSLHPGAGRRPLAMLTKAVALTTAARVLGKPCAMVGVGAGMLDSAMARRLARVMVRQTDLLVLRDEESAEVLAAAGASTPFRIGTDPAWGLVETTERRSAAGGAGGPVIVALSFLAGGPDLPARLGAALAPLVEEGRDVRLQPWQILGDGTVDDLGLAHAVNDHLPRPLPILDPPADLHAARDRVRVRRPRARPALSLARGRRRRRHPVRGRGPRAQADRRRAAAGPDRRGGRRRAGRDHACRPRGHRRSPAVRRGGCRRGRGRRRDDGPAARAPGGRGHARRPGWHRGAPAPARGMTGATITAPAAARPAGRLAALRAAVRDQGQVAAGQAVSGLGNLAFALVAARMLDPRGFSQLAALLAMYLLLHLPATSLSAGSALQPGLARRIRWRVLAGGTALGAAILAVGLPFADAAHLSPALVGCLAAAAPAAGLLALERGRHYGQGHGRLVASLAVEPAVRLTAGVALMATVGVAGAAVGVVLAGYLALAVAAGGAKVAHDPAARSASPAGLGSPWLAVAVFLLLALVQNQDVLLANATLGSAQAGQFAVLSTLGGIAAFATTTVPLVLLPRAAAGADHALAVALGAAVALGGGAALAVAVAPETIITEVFGRRYAPVAGLAVPYLLAMALLGVARVLAAHASATGGGRRTIWILAAVAALHVVLVLEIGDDAAGVATATLASTAVLAATLGAASATRLPAVSGLGSRAWRKFVDLDGPALVALTLVALGLRLLIARGLWLDEATTWYQAKLPTLGAMLDDIRTSDVHPPLHHILTWLSVRVAGDGEYALRIPSLAAGVLLVPALYGLGRELWDRRTGLIAAALATCAPILVWYSQEARMYALLLLFGVLAAWAQGTGAAHGQPLRLARIRARRRRGRVHAVLRRAAAGGTAPGIPAGGRPPRARDRPQVAPMAGADRRDAAAWRAAAAPRLLRPGPVRHQRGIGPRLRPADPGRRRRGRDGQRDHPLLRHHERGVGHVGLPLRLHDGPSGRALAVRDAGGPADAGPGQLAVLPPDRRRGASCPSAS